MNNNEGYYEANVGTIENYYGGLYIRRQNGKYYWGIKNYNGIDFTEIPEYLFMALKKYADENPQISYTIDVNN